MRQHSASGKHFDVVHAVVRELANFLAHFPWAVRFTVVEIPWKRDIRSETGHSTGPAGNCDVGAGDEHARTHYVAFIDRVAKRDVIESTVDADIANGSETGFQRDARVGNGFEHDLGRRAFELRHGVAVAVMGAVSEMRVAIDQAGEDRHFRKIDERCACGNGEVFADGFDFSVADDDRLIRERATGVDVDQSAGADYRDRRLLRLACESRGKDQQEDAKEFFKHGA